MKLSVICFVIILIFAGCGSLYILLDRDSLSGSLPAANDNSIFVVNVEDAPNPVKLATAVAAGLLNRHFDRPAVFTLLAVNDKKWVADIEQSSELAAQQWIRLSPSDLVAYSIAIGAATGTVVYDPAEPWSLANVVTMCGIQSAIPIPYTGLMSDEGQGHVSVASRRLLTTNGQNSVRDRLIKAWSGMGRTLKLRMSRNMVRQGADAEVLGLADLPQHNDVTGAWNNELDAGLYAWAHLFQLCEGTDDTIATQRPRLLEQGYLADFIVAKKMFLYYLPEMCNDGPQKLLFRSFAQKAFTAGKQLKVMGYNTASEVVADCSIHHTEISLVSDWCPNLSFLSRMQAQQEPWAQNSFSPAPAFNPNHTYLAVINSDGDNMQMENNGNRDGMEKRVEICAREGSLCPPLAWTISNQLLKFAPFQLQWYYRQAQKTGKDSFLMGPSGFGFIHPSALEVDSAILIKFVVDTVEAAQQLDMKSYVHWDVDGNDLTQALRYQMLGEREKRSNQTDVSGLGPSPLEALVATVRRTGDSLTSAARAAYLKHYDGTQIDTIFAPGEYSIPKWSGNVAGIEEQNRWFSGQSVDYVATAANNLPRGTVGYIYKIFDVAMEDLEEFATKVASHVHLVDHRQMHDIALQKKLYLAGDFYQA